MEYNYRGLEAILVRFKSIFDINPKDGFGLDMRFLISTGSVNPWSIK